MTIATRVLVVVTALDLIAALWWFSSRLRTTDGFIESGIEWRLIDDHPLNHDDAIRRCPKGFRVPSVEELITLSGSVPGSRSEALSARRSSLEQ